MCERMETVATSPSLISRPRAGADDEHELLDALRACDEHAFEVLLDRLSPSMLGFARSLVSDREVAQEVVQETWLAVLRGLERFEGRSSLKTWVFSILANVARTRFKRELRTVTFSSLSDTANPVDGLAAAAEQLTDHRHAWMAPTRLSKRTPEDQLLSREAVAVIHEALQTMPPRQAEVVTLRDVEGWSSMEVRQALGLSESNQKVLLHRGRSKIRATLEAYGKTQALESHSNRRAS